MSVRERRGYLKADLMARVLFVEDDKDLATAVEMALEAQNFIVEVVHDGRSALSRPNWGACAG